MRRTFVRFASALALLGLVASPAVASKSPTEINTEIDTNFADNKQGLITEAILRATLKDIAAAQTSLYYLVSTCTANQWVSGFAITGAPNCTRPSFSNLSGSISAGQMIAPGLGTLGGVYSSTAGANQFATGIDTTGAVLYAQPAFSNLSGTIAASQLIAPGASTFGAVKSSTAGANQFATGIDTSGVVTYSAIGAGAMPAFTGGDCTTSAGSVALNCTKTNGTLLVSVLTPKVDNNTALSALASTYATSVIRLGYSSAGDSPPVVYTPSGSACSLNAGAGDGGWQVPTSNGKCWIANFGGEMWASQFGAKGDGSTNDTTALNAIAVASQNRLGRVNLACGNYKITSTWSFSNPGNQVSPAVRGVAEGCVTISWAGSTSGTAVLFKHVTRFTVENFIVKNTVAQGSTTGIQFTSDISSGSDGGNAIISNVQTDGFYTGVQIGTPGASNALDTFNFNDVASSGSYYGVRVSGGNSLNINFYNLSTYSNSYGYYADGTADVNFYGGSSTGNTTADFSFGSGTVYNINGYRSEGANRFLLCGGSSSPAVVNVNAVTVSTITAGDGIAITGLNGGCLLSIVNSFIGGHITPSVGGSIGDVSIIGSAVYDANPIQATANGNGTTYRVLGSYQATSTSNGLPVSKFPDITGVISGGALKTLVSATSTGLSVLSGSSSNPSYSFLSDTTTGSYLVSPGRLGFTLGGAPAIDMQNNSGTNSIFYLGNGTGASSAQVSAADPTNVMRNSLYADIGGESGGLQTWKAGVGYDYPLYLQPNGGAVIAGGTYTYAALNAIAGLKVAGARAHVSDATACTFGGVLAGGGTTFCGAMWNGTNWVGR